MITVKREKGNVHGGPHADEHGDHPKDRQVVPVVLNCTLNKDGSVVKL